MRVVQSRKGRGGVFLVVATGNERSAISQERGFLQLVRRRRSGPRCECGSHPRALQVHGSSGHVDEGFSTVRGHAANYTPGEKDFVLSLSAALQPGDYVLHIQVPAAAASRS